VDAFTLAVVGILGYDYRAKGTYIHCTPISRIQARTFIVSILTLVDETASKTTDSRITSTYYCIQSIRFGTSPRTRSVLLRSAVSSWSEQGEAAGDGAELGCFAEGGVGKVVGRGGGGGGEDGREGCEE
jgi:hypothetical protein